MSCSQTALARLCSQEQEKEQTLQQLTTCADSCGAGVRKEFDVEGRQVLMFWYRNQIYAIEARSPAEGAYSEGFIKAKFTQVRKIKHISGCY